MRIEDVRPINVWEDDFIFNASTESEIEPGMLGRIEAGPSGKFTFHSFKTEKINIHTAVDLSEEQKEFFELFHGDRKTCTILNQDSYTKSLELGFKYDFRIKLAVAENRKDEKTEEIPEGTTGKFIFTNQSDEAEAFEEQDYELFFEWNKDGQKYLTPLEFTAKLDSVIFSEINSQEKIILLQKIFDDNYELEYLTQTEGILLFNFSADQKMDFIFSGNWHKQIKTADFWYSPETNNFILVIPVIYPVTLADSYKSWEFERFVNSNAAQICQVKAKAQNKIRIFINQYASAFKLMWGSVPLRLNPDLQLKAKKAVGMNSYEIIDNPNLVDQFVVRDAFSNKSFIFVQADHDNNNYFEIFGEDINLVVEKRRLIKSSNLEPIYSLNVIDIKDSRNKNNSKGIAGLTPVEADLTFEEDYTGLSRKVSASLINLTFDESAYLQTWYKYEEARGNRVLDKAALFGVRGYSNAHQNSDGTWTITLNKALEAAIVLKEDDSLDFSSEKEILPPWLNKIFMDKVTEDKTHMDWVDFCKWYFKDYSYSEDALSDSKAKDLKEKLKIQKDLLKKFRSEVKSSNCQVIGEYSKGAVSLVVKSDFKLPENGTVFLCVDQSGEIIQLTRQEKARKEICYRENPKQELVELLNFESNPENLNKKVVPSNPIEAYPDISLKIFGERGPTEAQKLAIKIALETPDIALIQGPPGTGKTTVICAVLEILNEEHNRKEENSGLFLITSYQHEAVSNVVDKIRLNGNPTFKFGNQNGKEAVYAEHVENFAKEIKKNFIRQYARSNDKSLRQEKNYSLLMNSNSELDKYYEKNPEAYKEIVKKLYEDFGITRNKNLEKLEMFYNRYTENPSNKNKVRLLSAMKTSVSVDKALFDKVDKLYEACSGEDMDEQEAVSFLPKIYALRTTAEGIAADGKKTYFNLINSIFWKQAEKILSEEQKNFLHQTYTLKNPDPDTEKIKEIKLLLKDFVHESLTEEVLEIDSHITALYAEIIEKEESKGGKLRVKYVSKFLQSLDEDPAGIEAAVKSYDAAYAVTAMQATGKSITKEKGYANPYYDTVIVDEAAKATPPDLLVPMSLAKNRIILVGDHRQLPHIPDDEIVETILKADGEFLEDSEVRDEFLTQEKQNLEAAMFQLLFERCKKIEENGGIKRTVTLDKQFRSPGLLGQLVSREFYAPYGEAFSSPLGMEHKNFEQKLEGLEGKCAAWLEVPSSADDREIKNSAGSYTRQSEVDAIINQLKKWKNSENGKKLSYGIISFYRGQADLIKKRLAAEGFDEKEMLNGKELLRSGTVDAFQGREFDVIFLSMVRTAEGPATKVKDKYGFLKSKNRLCVAMSREKKVLVICGDSALLKESDAENPDKIKPLCDYYNEICCGSEGVCL